MEIFDNASYSRGLFLITSFVGCEQACFGAGKVVG